MWNHGEILHHNTPNRFPVNENKATSDRQRINCIHKDNKPIHERYLDFFCERLQFVCWVVAKKSTYLNYNLNSILIIMNRKLDNVTNIHVNGHVWPYTIFMTTEIELMNTRTIHGSARSLIWFVWFYISSYVCSSM